jgi:predicted peptidase
MGGIGTWELAIARPDLFAAIVPVCGAGVPAAAGNNRSTPP